MLGKTEHAPKTAQNSRAETGLLGAMTELAGLDTWDPAPSLESEVGPLREKGATTALHVGRDVNVRPHDTRTRHGDGGVAETVSPGRARRSGGPAPPRAEGAGSERAPQVPSPQAPGGSPLPLHL